MCVCVLLFGCINESKKQGVGEDTKIYLLNNYIGKKFSYFMDSQFYKQDKVSYEMEPPFVVSGIMVEYNDSTFIVIYLDDYNHCEDLHMESKWIPERFKDSKIVRIEVVDKELVVKHYFGK